MILSYLVVIFTSKIKIPRVLADIILKTTK